MEGVEGVAGREEREGLVHSPRPLHGLSCSSGAGITYKKTTCQRTSWNVTQDEFLSSSCLSPFAVKSSGPSAWECFLHPLESRPQCPEKCAEALPPVSGSTYAHDKKRSRISHHLALRGQSRLFHGNSPLSGTEGGGVFRSGWKGENK